MAKIWGSKIDNINIHDLQWYLQSCGISLEMSHKGMYPFEVLQSSMKMEILHSNYCHKVTWSVWLEFDSPEIQYMGISDKWIKSIICIKNPNCRGLEQLVIESLFL